MIKIEQTENAEPEGETEAPEAVGDNISLQEAKDIAARLEAANKERRELLEREESLQAQKVLGGKADAGQKPEPKKEMSNEEYANRVMAGETPEK